MKMITIVDVVERKGKEMKTKTPVEWCKELNVKILDIDGWRMDNKSYDEPVSQKEFLERLTECTCQGDLTKLLPKKRFFNFF
jgi:hypothetical protein